MVISTRRSERKHRVFTVKSQAILIQLYEFHAWKKQRVRSYFFLNPNDFDFSQSLRDADWIIISVVEKAWIINRHILSQAHLNTSLACTFITLSGILLTFPTIRVAAGRSGNCTGSYFWNTSHISNYWITCGICYDYLNLTFISRLL